MVINMPVSGTTEKGTGAGDSRILEKSNIPQPRRKETARTADGVYKLPFFKQTNNGINKNRRGQSKSENNDDLLGNNDWKITVKSQDEFPDQQFNKVLVAKDLNMLANPKKSKLLSSLAINEKFSRKSMCHEDKSFATNITRNDPENGTFKKERCEDAHGKCKNMQSYDGEEHTSVKDTFSTKNNISQSNSLDIPLSKINISENILTSDLALSLSDKEPEVTEWTHSNSRVTENIHLADELYTYGCNKTTRAFSDGASSRKNTEKEDICLATVSKKLGREKMLRQDAELRLKEVQSESTQCKAHLVRLQRDLQRMEDIVRSLLHFKSQLDQLRHERTSITLKYESKIRKYQAYIATLEKGNLLLVNEMQRKEEENNKEKSEEEKEISINRVLLKRIQLLEQENASIVLENEEQRLQYEHCLDDVANQVVQALLGQKNLREECGRLEERVHYLEQQNTVLCSLLKQKQQPIEIGFSPLCIPTSTSQGFDDELLQPPPDMSQNELWTTCFLNSTSSNDGPMSSKHIEQNEVTSSSDNAGDTEEEEEIINTVRWKNFKRKISKSQSDVQLAKHTNKTEFMNFSGYSDSGNLWKVPQQQRKAIQHSKEHCNALFKPTFEKELLSVDNLSPLISSKKLSVPSHRTVQSVSAKLTQPIKQIDDIVINSSQRRFNSKALPYSTSSVYTCDDSSLSYLHVDNVAPEVENNLKFQSVVPPPCSTLDYDFQMFCTENQRNDPSKLTKHSICKKRNYFPREISRESSALESVDVSKSVEQSTNTNQCTNTVVRKSHSINDTGLHNVSQAISDTEFSGLLHSNENSSSRIEPDHISKDEGYSTMSSDIQVEIIENEKPNSQDAKSFSSNTLKHFVKKLNANILASYHKASIEKDGEMVSSSDSGLGLNQSLQTHLMETVKTNSLTAQLKTTFERTNSSIQGKDKLKKTYNSSSQKSERNSEININSEKIKERYKPDGNNTEANNKDSALNVVADCYGVTRLYTPQSVEIVDLLSENKKLSKINLSTHNSNVHLQASNYSHNNKEIISSSVKSVGEIADPKPTELSKLERVISKISGSKYPHRIDYPPHDSLYSSVAARYMAISRTLSDSVLYVSKVKQSSVCSNDIANSRLNFLPLERRVSLSELQFPESLTTGNKDKAEKGNTVPLLVQHIQTWRRLEGSPSCSDSLSSVHSSTSEVTNSEEFEDLNPTSLKCSRDNDLCSASEDEYDIPEHHKFVQQWLQLEGEQLMKDCQRLYTVDKKETGEWTFQLYLEDVMKSTSESEDNNIEAVIPSNNTSHLVLGSIKEEKEMEDEPFKTILELCASDVSKLHLSKTGPSKTNDITELTYSADKHHHESFAGVSFRKIDKETASMSGYASSDCSREIDRKRATIAKRNWQTTETSYSDKTENGCIPVAPVSVSKHSTVIPSEKLLSEKRTSQTFQRKGHFSQIKEDSAPKTLQCRHSSSHKDVYNSSYSERSEICEKKEECHLESNSNDCEETELAKLNERSMPINSCLPHIESKNDSRDLAQNKEYSALSKPVTQNSTKHAKVKPDILHKPCSLTPGNSRIPLPGNQKNVECRQQINNRTKIPVCIKPTVTVSKKENKSLGGHKQKMSPNRNVAYTKAKINPHEKHKKTSKDSKNIAMKQEEKIEKEISQNISQRIKKPLIKNHKNQNYDKAPNRSTFESPETKSQTAFPNHQSVSVELEQLSFESSALSVAQKIQILNNLLDESENSSISRLHNSDFVETCSVSPGIGLEVDGNDKEGCRSSWIHVSPEVDILSQLEQSSPGSSEESEEDLQEKESYHEEKLNNGCNSGIFPKSPEKQDLTKKCLKDRTSCRYASKEGEKEVLIQNVKSDSFSIVSNSPIRSKAIGMTDSCMSVLSQEECSSERVSFSDSCAESFCSSTISLDL
ncbi:uncharacterized protein LOC106456860 isoform X2 [Limulus polyphemus]|uniref:Uncharacterized protein LOC106456860 isoform X2 n=1 Tax=Limulus polyphemus TaxID=6850 RepID=A0ABM1S408_LIMPO|nr:uncharacterized protein LOC106456860 isoform X2 [Limulus polyphemus]